MNKLRRSYEARVLLVPLGRQAGTLAGAMARSGLDGVMVMSTEPGHAGPSYLTRPLAGNGWPTAAASTELSAVQDADMTVMVAADLAEVDQQLAQVVAQTAGLNGTLVAALVVGRETPASPEAESAMVTLREAVDMVVIVRSLRLATPFIDVLRGGARQPLPVG